MCNPSYIFVTVPAAVVDDLDDSEERTDGRNAVQQGPSADYELGNLRTDRLVCQWTLPIPGRVQDVGQRTGGNCYVCGG